MSWLQVTGPPEIDRDGPHCELVPNGVRRCDGIVLGRPNESCGWLDPRIGGTEARLMPSLLDLVFLEGSCLREETEKIEIMGEKYFVERDDLWLQQVAILW